MKTTALHAAHASLGAKMGEFAGYDMPLYYGEGVLKEHEWVRTHAGLFDVSHMGQVIFRGNDTARFLERITPSNFQNAKINAAKYTVLTNESGGIVDDLIITKLDDTKFFTVINAGCKEKDIAWIVRHLPGDIELQILDERALVALQGPEAGKALLDVANIDTSGLGYMRMMDAELEGTKVFISRLGYTGEDGFEISIPSNKVESLWNRLLAHPSVKPVGLAARDSLRLEMGYCLYGHDIDEETTPLEADLSWVMGKGNAGFIGAERVGAPKRKRVGIRLMDKGIAREGAEIRTVRDEPIGALTSGTFSPTLKQAIGQGYVPTEYAKEGTQILVHVRGNNILAEVVPMPFIQPKVKK